MIEGTYTRRLLCRHVRAALPRRRFFFLRRVGPPPPLPLAPRPPLLLLLLLLLLDKKLAEPAAAPALLRGVARPLAALDQGRFNDMELTLATGEAGVKVNALLLRLMLSPASLARLHVHGRPSSLSLLLSL